METLYHQSFTFSTFLFRLFDTIAIFYFFVYNLLFSFLFDIIVEVLFEIRQGGFMTKKIIAVDLDGTLLNSDSKISDFTKETIKKI